MHIMQSLCKSKLDNLPISSIAITSEGESIVVERFDTNFLRNNFLFSKDKCLRGKQQHDNQLSKDDRSLEQPHRLLQLHKRSVAFVATDDIFPGEVFANEKTIALLLLACFVVWTLQNFSWALNNVPSVEFLYHSEINDASISRQRHRTKTLNSNFDETNKFDLNNRHRINDDEIFEDGDDDDEEDVSHASDDTDDEENKNGDDDDVEDDGVDDDYRPANLEKCSDDDLKLLKELLDVYNTRFKPYIRSEFQRSCQAFYETKNQHSKYNSKHDDENEYNDDDYEEDGGEDDEDEEEKRFMIGCDGWMEDRKQTMVEQLMPCNCLSVAINSLGTSALKILS